MWDIEKITLFLMLMSEMTTIVLDLMKIQGLFH